MKGTSKVPEPNVEIAPEPSIKFPLNVKEHDTTMLVFLVFRASFKMGFGEIGAEDQGMPRFRNAAEPHQGSDWKPCEYLEQNIIRNTAVNWLELGFGAEFDFLSSGSSCSHF